MKSMKYAWFWILPVMLTLSVTTWGQATQPAAKTLPTTRLSKAIPTAYGHYRLRFLAQLHGQPINWCVVCSNSHLIANTKGKVPVVVFLCGAGERGDDGDGEFLAGPSAWMQRVELMDAACPVLAVSPQCPADRSWYEPEVTELMVHFLDVLVQDPRIDPERVYLTGLSMGGGGTLSVAAAGRKYLAAAAALCPPLTEPETTIPALKNLPLWIIVSKDDGRFAEGCRTMMQGLRKEHADTIYTELPGDEHGIWPNIYPKLEFYDWLLTHTRGKPLTRTFSDAELMKIASQSLKDALAQKVEHDFSVFAPYWQIVNWNRDFEPGLHDQITGRKNVFSAPALNQSTACLMQTTWKMPADKHGQLHIVAGHGDKEDWKLVVNVADKEALSIAVDATTAPDGWLDKTIDLAAWKGKEVHIDVFAKAGAKPGHVYFAKLAVEIN